MKKLHRRKSVFFYSTLALLLSYEVSSTCEARTLTIIQHFKGDKDYLQMVTPINTSFNNTPKQPDSISNEGITTTLSDYNKGSTILVTFHCHPPMCKLHRKGTCATDKQAKMKKISNTTKSLTLRPRIPDAYEFDVTVVNKEKNKEEFNLSNCKKDFGSMTDSDREQKSDSEE